MESQIENFGRADGQPLVSIVVLNCNGAGWLPKCFETIKAQTILGQIEAIMVDNNSTDDSVAVARRLLADFPCARIVRNSADLGFCEGNNSGARAANGRYLFFLNNDTWMETDCMERVIAGTAKFHKRSAFWMLRFFRLKLNRWFEIKRLFQFGLPRVDAR